MPAPDKPKRRADGEAIQRLARERGWGQKKLISLNCGLSSVQKAWRGKECTLDILTRIAAKFGDSVSVDDICVSETRVKESAAQSTRDSSSADSGSLRLLSIVSEILSRSDAARKLILRHNSFSDDLDAAELAAEIFSAERPMELLFKCVDQSIDKAHRS